MKMQELMQPLANWAWFQTAQSQDQQDYANRDKEELARLGLEIDVQA